MTVVAIELFAGAGGLGLGAQRAGADVRVSVELDKAACETLRKNGCHGTVVEGDVAKLSGEELRKLARVKATDRLIVTGGPPCQPFSKAAYWTDPGLESKYRRAREQGHKAEKPLPPPVRPDARRTLVEEYFRLIAEADADGFMFENVPSIVHPRNRPVLENLLEQAAAAGFDTAWGKVNATEYGVPQRRERVVVLGSRRGKPQIPEATHAATSTRGKTLIVSAGQALTGIEAPFEPEEVVSGRYAEHLRTVPPGQNYKAHTAWAGHPHPTFVTETRFWNFLLKLDPALPSWTIPANPGPWIGPFHWDSRRLRTQELAVLQGFPSTYVFSGSRRERVRQIGNAVPPPLGSAMVTGLLEAVTGKSRKSGTKTAPPQAMARTRQTIQLTLGFGAPA